jgi:diguanylate cyclase (GGDEF)-like protein
MELEKTYMQVNIANQKLAELNLELDKLASIDDLTQLTNHRIFKEFLQKEWKRAFRKKTPISLILLDVDFFKQYNDLYGHQKGDKCLAKIAGVLNQMINRSNDLAARYGGEEFVIVLSETNLNGAKIVAERIRHQIEKLEISHRKSIISRYVTVSLGIASRIPGINETWNELFKEADNALYKAKGSGRNRVVSAD